MSLKIPEIPEVLIEPVQTLANAARLLQAVLARALEGRPLTQILDEQADYLALACRVIDVWTAHLGKDEEKPKGCNGAAHQI